MEKAEDVTNSPYAPWLEKLIEMIMQDKPVREQVAPKLLKLAQN